MFIIVSGQSNAITLPPKVNWNQQSVGKCCLADEKFDMSLQCTLAAQKASYVLSCRKRSVTSRLRDINSSPPFHFGETNLEYCIQLWRPPRKEDLSESREGPWWSKERLGSAGRQSGFCSTWRRLQRGFIAT